MKKLLYLISLVLIIGVIITGCNVNSNDANVTGENDFRSLEATVDGGELVTVKSGDVLEIRFDVPVLPSPDNDMFFIFANGSTVTGYFTTITEMFDGDTLIGTYTEGWSQITSRWVTADSLSTIGTPQVIDFSSLLYGSIDGLTRMTITGDNSITFDTEAVQGKFGRATSSTSWYSDPVEARILSVTVNTLFSEMDSRFGPKTITVDHQTGKKWLDLNLTTNRSYDEIIVETSPGGEFEGFRHATSEEVLELFSNAVFYLDAWTPQNYNAFNFLVAFIGISYEIPGFPSMWGMTGDTTGTPPNVRVGLGVASKEDRPENLTYKMGLATYYPDNTRADTRYETSGHWLIAFDNNIPIADAGPDQNVIVGDLIQLNGFATDPDGDLIDSWSWTIESAPVGSGAYFDDPLSQTPIFTTDLPGEYVLSLVVNDGVMDSAPATTTITAVTIQDAAVDELMASVDTINGIDPSVLKNKNMSNALTNKINAALELIDQELYQEALDKLQHDILGKTNGCAEIGSPDKNDWITNCDDQGEVYSFILEAIELVSRLL